MNNTDSFIHNVINQQNSKEYMCLENTDHVIDLTIPHNTFVLLARLESLQNKPKSQRWPAAIWPSDQSFEDARQFITKLPSSNVHIPNIGLADDGEVNFLWKQNGIHIDLGFYGDGTYSYYARRTGESGFYGDNIPVGQELPNALSALISY